MIKINTSKKIIQADDYSFEFTMSLFKGDISGNFPDDEYTIVSETPDSMAVMPAGKNYVIAELLYTLFFQNDVLPANLEGIAEDILEAELS